MARTVNPARHEARRLQIIDAALTCFATEGYDRATTAAICRTARIGSGTLFHYFPSKAAILVAILELGAVETQEWFAAQGERTDALGVLRDYVAHTAEELTDERVAGFVRAVGAVMAEPAVAAALALDEEVARERLTHWVALAQERGEIRSDLSAPRLASWLRVLLNGFIDRIATEEQFTAAEEMGTLSESVERLLAD